jgi:hypothetical protein
MNRLQKIDFTPALSPIKGVPGKLHPVNVEWVLPHSESLPETVFVESAETPELRDARAAANAGRNRREAERRSRQLARSKAA